MIVNVRPRTLRTRLGLAFLGALAVAGVVSIPAAKADPDGLVSWAYSNGFTGTANTITIRGALVCADLADGANGEGAAIVEQLCPVFDHRHDAPAPISQVVKS